MIEAHLGRTQYSQRYALRFEGMLEFLRCTADIDGPVVVAASMHVGSYDGGADSRCNSVTGETQRRSQIFGTIVDPGKEMAVKVNHARLEEYPLL